MDHYTVELLSIVASLKDEAAIYANTDERAPNEVNCPSWLLGHTAFSIYDMILRPLGSTIVFPENYMEWFKTGSIRLPEEEYPELQEVVSFLDGITSEAKALLERSDTAAIELPDDLKSEGFFSMENLITHTIRDVAYHCGQLSYLNRLI